MPHSLTSRLVIIDIKVGDFWGGGPFETTFLVLNPHMDSNMCTPLLAATYRKEMRCYEQRVLEVESSSFTILVFSSTNSTGPSASTVIKRLASLLSLKHDTTCTYSVMVGWLCCCLSFALRRMCVPPLPSRLQIISPPTTRGMPTGPCMCKGPYRQTCTLIYLPPLVFRSSVSYRCYSLVQLVKGQKSPQPVSMGKIHTFAEYWERSQVCCQ